MTRTFYLGLIFYKNFKNNIVEYIDSNYTRQIMEDN